MQNRPKKTLSKLWLGWGGRETKNDTGHSLKSVLQYLDTMKRKRANQRNATVCSLQHVKHKVTKVLLLFSSNAMCDLFLGGQCRFKQI